MASKEFVCIVCPNSCKLVVEEMQGELTVTGASCNRGIVHGKNEYTNPKRMLTSTVAVSNGIHPRIPVISQQEIPKSSLPECLEYLYQMQVSAPISCGDVIVSDICKTKINIVASRSMKVK